jgi:arginine utilization regulatory protein
VGESHLLRESADLAVKVSQNSSSVMLIGETGVGKEIFAQAIHYESPRRNCPYTAINCSAVPETLLEGILFGTVKGAFTGAENKAGLFEVTRGGTLYLDEIDSMPITLQNKLLRVLQEKKVRRVGEGYERAVDVRIISSVGKNPVSLVEEGRLRQDFYYRLGVVKIRIPPLRARMEDIHPLVQHFLQLCSARLGVPLPLVTPEAMAVFYAHSWPGNVRELEHSIEATLALVEPGSHLEPRHIYYAVQDIRPINQPQDATTPWLAFEDRRRQNAPAPAQKTRDAPAWSLSANPSPVQREKAEEPEMPPPENRAAGLKENRASLTAQMKTLEAATIGKALRASAGNVAAAARLLGMSPQVLHYKMKKHAIRKDSFLPVGL